MRIFTYIIVILIFLLGITFAILNQVPVEFNYYIGKQILPLSLLLTLFFISGAVLGLSVGFWMSFKLKLKNYRLQQKLKVAYKEIDNLRAIPLQDRD